MILDMTIPFVEKRQVWEIGIFESRGGRRFYPAAGVRQPVLTAGDVKDAKAKFVADPFMVWERDRWHLFFEMFNGTTKKGDIALAESEDGEQWNYRQGGLEGPVHLC